MSTQPDYLPTYLREIKELALSAEEETELLARWHRYKDMNARARVIEGTLHVVPPIARSMARKFRLDEPNELTKTIARSERWQGRKLQSNSCMRELIGEGNLALVVAFDAFPRGANTRFAYYARTCVRNELVHRAAGLLSSVSYPRSQRVTQDVFRDETLPDPILLDESAGYRARSTSGLKPGQAARARLRAAPIEPRPDIRLPPILEQRAAGKKLREIAEDLDCSIATAHRRVKAAIHQAREAHHATRSPDC